MRVVFGWFGWPITTEINTLNLFHFVAALRGCLEKHPHLKATLNRHGDVPDAAFLTQMLEQETPSF